MIRHALRTIGRMPGVAAVVILSLGIGIGVNTAVFSWIQALVLKPIPGVDGSAGFYNLEPKADTGSYPGMSWPEYRDIAPRLQAIEEPAAFRMAPLNVGESGRTERTFALLASGNYFGALGLQPAAGRFIRPDEADVAGAEPIVVLSHDYWQTRFGGSAAALGQTLRVNENVLTIIGVAPEGFQGTVMGLQFDLWVPATLAPVLVPGSAELESRNQRGYAAIGRLREGATEAAATAQFVSAMSDLATTFPESNGRISGELRPFWKAARGPQMMFITALAVLQGLMLLVLLAVCGNTANLMLARASTRYREVGVRVALGAGPGSVIRLMLVENLLLGVAGAALGILIAWWGTEALRAMPAYGAFPVRFQTSLDGLGLLFAAILGVGSGLVFGAAPALQLGRVDPQQALRSGSKSAGRSVLRDGLMALQSALALLVLVVAGLFFQSFAETRGTDPGFRVDGVMLATYDLGPLAPGDDYARQFAANLLEKLQRVPTIESVALANAMPLDIHGLPSRVFTVEGHARVEPGFDRALANTVTPGYFDLMNIPFRTGTGFAPLADETAGPQVIVNDEFVRRYLAGLEPLGRRLQARGRTYVIIGVVRNSLYNAFGEPPTAIVYFSYRDNPAPGGEIHVRTRPGSEHSVAPEIRRVVSSIDPELPVFNVRTLNDHVETNLVFRRVPARMFAFLGPMLLVLAAIGIYAVVAYSVSQRTTEIGVRIAVGASAGRIAGQIVGETMAVAGLGALAGWSLALLVAMDVAGGTIDVPVFAGVPAILLTVAAIAAWLPVRRAARLDPVVALRNE